MQNCFCIKKKKNYKQKAFGVFCNFRIPFGKTLLLQDTGGGNELQLKKKQNKKRRNGRDLGRGCWKLIGRFARHMTCGAGNAEVSPCCSSRCFISVSTSKMRFGKSSCLSWGSHNPCEMVSVWLRVMRVTVEKYCRLEWSKQWDSVSLQKRNEVED